MFQDKAEISRTNFTTSAKIKLTFPDTAGIESGALVIGTAPCFNSICFLSCSSSNIFLFVSSETEILLLNDRLAQYIKVYMFHTI